MVHCYHTFCSAAIVKCFCFCSSDLTILTFFCYALFYFALHSPKKKSSVYFLKTISNENISGYFISARFTNFYSEDHRRKTEVDTGISCECAIQ